MSRIILHVLQQKRHDTAIEVQKVLTDHGCLIKTRIGLHQTSESSCSEDGLIILELLNDKTKAVEMKNKLSSISGVKTELVEL